MSRSLRVEYEFAWHHIMNRGSNHGNIFNDSEDKRIFLELIAACYKRYGTQIHAYCLMDNHFHLLMCTPKPFMFKAMQLLGSKYTKFYNQKNGLEGSLFRDRYRSFLVESEEYLFQVSRYIHLNPTSAGMIKDPKDYTWSSMRYYCGEPGKPFWLTTEKILASFQKSGQETSYEDYVKLDSVCKK